MFVNFFEIFQLAVAVDEFGETVFVFNTFMDRYNFGRVISNVYDA